MTETIIGPLCGIQLNTVSGVLSFRFGLTNGLVNIRYVYDAKHRRVAAFYGPPNGPTTIHDSRNLFVYDGWNVLYEQEDVQYGGTWECYRDIDYFGGPDLSGTLQGAGGVGGLVAVSIGGQYYFPCYDNMGNIVAYVDEAGTTVASYSRRHGDRPIWNLCRFFSGGWTVRGGQW